jgi:acetyltransferase-like isoleucine patch superfamily enzyme
MSSFDRKGLEKRLKDLAKPIAKKILHGSAITPGPASRWFFQAIAHADVITREAYELARRSFVATPAFLAQCESFGERIAVDRIPYIQGTPRITLGSDIRFSGQVGIKANRSRDCVLKIGNGVFVGHGTTFVVAERIEIGDFASIGGGCYIADTDGHANYNPNRPIWEVPATDAEISPVIIEDNVQISRDVTILKGVRIGARSIIGAGSVVRSDIPPDAVVAGNPGRVIKRMQPTAVPPAEPVGGAAPAPAAAQATAAAPAPVAAPDAAPAGDAAPVPRPA